MARRIRADFPEKLTLLGGAHANVAEEHAATEYPWFDIVVFGPDGEETTLEVMEAFANKGHSRQALLADHDLQRQIKGIVFREDGRVIKNLPRPAIADLDYLPFPARDLYPMEKYIPLPNQYKRLPVVHMVVIRGCPYSCTFCDQANTGGRMRRPKKVVEEIRDVVERYGAREISFWDDTMSFNKRWMREFCNELIEAKLDVIWCCYAAVNTVTKPLLELMAKSGYWNIFYGYETGVPELAKNIESYKKNTS